MRIAILGTRGIPNNHGGFEQFAEYLSKYLVKKNHEVFVYNSHTHPYQEKTWNGVYIIHKKDPENKIGTVGQFIYDFNCIKDSRKRNFDIILQLGYTSSSIWGWFLPKTSVVLTNMDGLEWKRAKYNTTVKRFLKVAEKLAIRTSDFLIADSIGIKEYLNKAYDVESEYIPYGANNFIQPDEGVLQQYSVNKQNYNMLIARLEPENNIETILDGVMDSMNELLFLVIGKHNTTYGEHLKTKYLANKKIIFLGGIYNTNHLDNLRHFSNLYFHGHSVGGTNPSLLEAMASNALIAAHNNVFNQSILGEDAFYFDNKADIKRILENKKENYFSFVLSNQNKILETYSWGKINKAYEAFMIDSYNKVKSN